MLVLLMLRQSACCVEVMGGAHRCVGASVPATQLCERGASMVRTLAKPRQSLNVTARLAIRLIKAASSMASPKGFASDPDTDRT